VYDSYSIRCPQGGNKVESTYPGIGSWSSGSRWTGMEMKRIAEIIRHRMDLRARTKHLQFVPQKNPNCPLLDAQNNRDFDHLVDHYGNRFGRISADVLARKFFF